MYLASCSYEDAKKYTNRLVLASEETKGKRDKKPTEVYLNIVTDDPDTVLEGGLGIARCLTTSVRPSICPDELWGHVFHEIPLEEFNGVDEEEGVVCLVRLPEGFSDMRKVYDLCKDNDEYDDVEAKVRVIGGNLLEIPGINIGRYDSGKEKMSAVFNGVYDFFTEVALEDIEVSEVMSKVRSTKKKSSSGSNGKAKTTVKKPNAKSKKKEAFSRFFSESGSGF